MLQPSRRRTAVALAIAAVLAGASAAPGIAAGASPTTTTGATTTSTSPTAPPTAAPPAIPTHGGSGSTSTAIAPGTPVLSVRRVPDWIDATAADKQVAAGLPALMAKLGPAASASCLDVTQGGITIFAAHPNQPETPASNMKLLTATAVLDKLGPDTRLRTRVTATGRIVHGVLRGNLYLIGGGDPLLHTPGYQADLDLPEPNRTSLPQLAAQVKAAGITAIRGKVIGDEHLFDSVRTVPTWKPDYAADDDVGPLSALEVNDGFSPTKPFGPAAQPAAMAATVFAGLLRGDGIKIKKGPGTEGISPRSARRVTSILSPPMSSIVDTILQVSDDTGAELLTKLLGERWGGAGSTAAGTRVIRADLAADGLPVGAFRDLDGSGLDTGDRVSCALIADTLERAGTTSPIFAGLPIAGKTGTLNDRMNGTAAQGRVHAKTGTLDTVSALSGFVMPATGVRASVPQLAAPITFSFISNDLPGDYLGIEVGDAVAVYLAATKAKAPPLADALPRPATP